MKTLYVFFTEIYSEMCATMYLQLLKGLFQYVTKNYIFKGGLRSWPVRHHRAVDLEQVAEPLWAFLFSQTENKGFRLNYLSGLLCTKPVIC